MDPLTDEEAAKQPPMPIGKTAQGRKIRIALLLVAAISLVVVAAKIAGANIPFGVVIVGIVLFSIIGLLFALRYWVRRVHTPEALAAMQAELQAQHDRIKFADGTTKYKREVLRTGAVLGPDTETIFGSFTNDDFSNGDFTIDLANFGGGWENEWIDIPGTGLGSGMSDLLITPLGDFALFGTFF
ncbi:MAG: hypothetical protein ACRDTV_12925 [Mycobacterium sp.]